MVPGKIGGVTPVSLKTQSFLDRTYTCTFSTINTHKYTHEITRQEIIRGSANIAYIHQQESFTMSKFLQLTIHAHITQLHFASEKSRIHSSQQIIIELDKKLTLLPHPHPSSLLFLTLKKLFGISPWDISLSFFGVFSCFSRVAFYRPRLMLHGQQSPSSGLKSIGAFNI
jgi:hypothetical protein